MEKRMAVCTAVLLWVCLMIRTLPAEMPPDTQSATPDAKEPIRFTEVQIAIITIAAVAACFVGVELYLTRKRSKADLMDMAV